MSTPQPICILLGAGGHAKVIVDCVRSTRIAEIVGILDSNPQRWGHDILGVPVLGNDELLPKLKQRGVSHFVVAIAATGNNGLRETLFLGALNAGFGPLNVFHSTAICSPSAHIGEGAQLLPGCILNAGATVGRNVIINTGAIVEHDCVVDEHSHIGPGARLAGHVEIGCRSFIGMGACVRQGVKVGCDSVIGAGAVVVKDVPDGVVVTGVPARFLRKTRSESGTNAEK
jgi:UDP-perosamine 4-acetyltransferase